MSIEYCFNVAELLFQRCYEKLVKKYALKLKSFCLVIKCLQ